MRPEPMRRKGRKTLAKIYDSLSDPEETADRSRIIGLPTKKEARGIRDELTAAAWAAGKTVSRTQTAKEYISIVESFFRKLRAIKNTETRTLNICSFQGHCYCRRRPIALFDDYCGSRPPLLRIEATGC